MTPLIRRLGLIATALLAASPAYADVTARYLVDQQPVSIQANAKGDSRTERGSTVTIVRDGTRYVVDRQEDGDVWIYREADAARALVGIFEGIETAVAGEPSKPEAGSPPAADAPQFTLSEQGAATVAGEKGVRYRFTLSENGKTERGDLVVSRDPDLAPVGRALFQGQPDGTETLWKAVLSRGAPLRVGTFIALQSVDRSPVPADAFTLPGPVMTADQLREKMAAKMFARPEAKPD